MFDDKAANGFGVSAPLSRRSALGGLSLLPLLAVIGVLPTASAETAYRFLSTHQAAVLDAATRRLVPGPQDSSLELGHPGAHEAHVVTYLDRMLSVFDVSPPDVHAGGPWSNRAGGSPDFMAGFVPLNRAQTYAWRRRVAQLRDDYTNGIALLDQQAGGDFTSVSPTRQDTILALGEASSFTSVLLDHTIEAIYAVPEYGGNANLVGWRDISYPGDSQPRGYTDAEVEAAEIDPIGIPPDGIIARLLNGGWEQVVTVTGGIGGLGLLSWAAVKGSQLRAASADTAYRFLSAHQAAVLDAATRRLVPGPQDSPLEAGHPGAHEAGVVTYLDRLLSVFDVSPANRAQTYAWRQRVAQLRDEYGNGIALLDQQAGGDFTSVSPTRQDTILGQSSFTSLLFGHTVEAMYAVPEYDVEAPEFDPVGIPPNGIIARLLDGGWEQAVTKMGGKGGVNAGD